MMKKTFLILATALLFSACSYGTATPSASTQTPSATQAQAPNTLAIKDYAFSPVNLTVKAGATVTVKNNDTVPHTVTGDTAAFDSGNIPVGTTGTFTAPTKPGTYTFHCTIHPTMKGTLIVE